MGKSYKKPIVKDKSGKKGYHSRIRSRVKNIIRSKDITELEDALLPLDQELINDYDYSDYKLILDDDKYKRK